MTDVHRTPPRRSRHRRRRAALVLGATLTAALASAVTLLSSPAAAALPLTPLAAQTVLQADQALANSDCAALIGPGSRALLANLRANDRIIEAADQNPGNDDGSGGDTAAGINGIGLGGFSMIRLYAAFYPGAYNPTDFDPPPTTPLTPNEVRRVVLLHELAHATGALDRHTAADPGFRFNSQIVSLCVRPSSSPPPRVGSLSCGAFPSLGWWRFICNASWTGGTGPVVLAWRSYYEMTPDYTDLTNGRARASGACPQGIRTSVSLTVTGADGQFDAVTASGFCP